MDERPFPPTAIEIVGLALLGTMLALGVLAVASPDWLTREAADLILRVAGG